jgi:hypothetical protein
MQESWDDTYTILTVTPIHSLPEEQSFQIFLNEDLRSASGAALKEMPEWKITTPDAPFVTGHLPGSSELKDRRQELQLSFSRAMDPVQVAAALHVQPQIQYELSWIDEQTLLINPLEAFAPATRYRFTLSETATDLDGIPLRTAYHWEQWFGEWDIKVSFPYQAQSGKAINYNFTYPVDRESMESSLRLEPQATGRWVWTADSRASVFFDEPLPLGKTYTLSLQEGVQDVNGDPLPILEPSQFMTPPPILDYGPRETILIDGGLEVWIQSTARWTRGTIRSTCSRTIGEFSWEENTLIFTSTGSLPLYAEYTASLDSSAVDELGMPILMEPFTWTFNIQPLDPLSGSTKASFGDFGPNGQVVDADGRRSVQFVADPQLGTVTFELYRLSLEQFLDRYSSRFRGVAGREKLPISTEDTTLETSWEQPLAASGGGYQEDIFETFIPPEVGPGLYILNLIYDGGQDQLILVFTRNTIVLKQVEGQIVAWVSDINGGSMPNLPVSIYARDGSWWRREIRMRMASSSEAAAIHSR